MVLVGVGHLGTALLGYNFYRSHSTKIVAGFDTDPGKVGTEVEGIPVFSMDRFAEVRELHHVEVAILTVPANEAQATTDRIVASGIRGILNFTPARLTVPRNVRLHHIDLTIELQTLIYFLKNFPRKKTSLSRKMGNRMDRADGAGGKGRGKGQP